MCLGLARIAPYMDGLLDVSILVIILSNAAGIIDYVNETQLGVDCLVFERGTWFMSDMETSGSSTEISPLRDA